LFLISKTFSQGKLSPCVGGSAARCHFSEEGCHLFSRSERTDPWSAAVEKYSKGTPLRFLRPFCLSAPRNLPLSVKFRSPNRANEKSKEGNWVEVTQGRFRPSKIGRVLGGDEAGSIEIRIPVRSPFEASLNIGSLE